MPTVSPVPDDQPNLTPYITVDDAGQAIDFYKQVFGAEELMRMPAPGGRIGHAELKIGNSRLMLSDEFPDMDARGPKTIGGTSFCLHLYVEDSDAVAARAEAAGATIQRPVADQFYGDRGGMIMDPFGHKWWISSRKENLSPDELRQRAAQASSS